MSAREDVPSIGPSSADQRPTLEQYREALASRHAQEETVDADGVANAVLTFNLMRLQSRLSQDFESLHRRRGWTWAGFRIMNVLWALGPMDQRDVARLSGGSRAAISSAVNTLERDSLVVRTRDSRDGRLVKVALTDRGTTALKEGMREQSARERRWFQSLTSAQREALSDALAMIAEQTTPD